MSTKARTVVKSANLKSGSTKPTGFHVLNSESALQRPSESPKAKRVDDTKRRSSLTSPTAASKARETAPRASRTTVPQKGVVVKVITAASLRAAQTTKERPTASPALASPLTLPEPSRERKTQVKRPLDDDEDDIFAYYAKKKKRMEELSLASKAPAISTSKPIAAVSKPIAPTRAATTTKPSGSQLAIPAAKRRATTETIRAKSTAKPSPMSSK